MKRFLIIIVVVVLLAAGLALLSFYLNTNYPNIRSRGHDWPMWRYDASRSAASPHKLPDRLHLQWVREYPKLTQAWENPLNQDLMQFDRVYEPVVMGRTLFIGSSVSDRMLALDTDTGEEKWAFYVDGPVRFPPVAWDNKVYFVSDDGYLYCVDAHQGKLIWKFRGGPSQRKMLGNERLISTWPARGGPVLKDGVVYFAAGIWPFMGIFIYALDAETGKVIWENDSTGPIYMNQPHNSPSYAGVAPQGSFVIAGDKLLVPCGRSMPACFDRQTGKLLYYRLADYNKTGGAFVAAQGDYFVNYHRNYVTSIFDLSTGDRLISQFGNIPVMTKSTLFSMGESITAYDLKNMREFERDRIDLGEKNGKIEVVRDKSWVLGQLWKCNVDASGDLIKAGNRLYAGGNNVVSAVKIPWFSKEPEVVWRAQIAGTATRLIAGDHKLFVVTLEGNIYAFGDRETKPRIYPYNMEKSSIPEGKLARAASILADTGIRDGYCLAYGLETGEVVEALARSSNLRIIALDPDPVKVDRLRRKFDAVGLYGKRLSVQIGGPLSFEVAPYLASLTVFENLEAAGYKGGEDFFRKIYHAVRPYGGTVYLPVSGHQIETVAQQIEELDLPNANVHIAEHDSSLSQSEKLLLLTREGPLPGAADWTHQYGDIANTVKSDDQLVKPPLGILWFGGSSNTDVLPRHGHGPPEQVIGGRLFIEGIGLFSARDVYTGRVLWKRNIPDMDTYGVYYGETYADTPLDPSYNQIHIPGANARGTNFVAAPDKIYIAKKDSCLILDPATGKTIEELELPTDQRTGSPFNWGYIGVYKDYLIAGAGYVHYLDFLELDEITPEKTHKRLVFYNYDITSSKKLVIMNRHTGKILWTRDSELGFRNNAIAVGDDRIFCIDTIPDSISEALKRRLGEYHLGHPRLMALNVHSGRVVWSTDKDVFGTWLSYSKKRDILVQAGRSSRDMLRGEVGEIMTAHRGGDGTVLWSEDVSYGGPIMLHGDTIFTDRYAYSLLTGEQQMRTDPLTGEERPWLFKRNYGCNYAIASEHMLMFRSAAAGFYDLSRDGGTGNFGGFKTGCTSNLIAANGVLNAPDYTRTCSCSYQNQTSLALVHMPDVEMWTTYFDERADDAIVSSSSAIALSDPEGNLTYVNNRFLKMWGYDDDSEVLEKPITEFWQSEDEALAVLEALRANGTWAGEVVALDKDGETLLSLYLFANMVTDEAGKPVSMIVSFVDITDKATALFDLKGNLTYASSALLKLLEYEEDEVLGRPFVDFCQMREKALQIIKVLRHEGKWTGEIVAVTEDGEELDVHLSANMVADKLGSPVSMKASFVDITDYKEALKRAQELGSQLRAARNIKQLITGDKPIRAVGINLGAPGDRVADDGILWLEYPRVGGPSPDVPVIINHEELLFSIDPELEADLDAKAIPEELRQRFDSEEIPLSRDAVVSVQRKHRAWLLDSIIIGNDRKTYIIRKEGDRLNVYHRDYERYSHHSSRIETAKGLNSVPAWIAASGIKGISSVTITLAGDPPGMGESKPVEQFIEERPYTVRLYFSEPDRIKPGQRIFDVAIQGQKVLENFDIVKEAGGPNRPVIKEFKEILVRGELTMAFTPSSDTEIDVPMVSGVEVTAEGW